MATVLTPIELPPLNAMPSVLMGILTSDGLPFLPLIGQPIDHLPPSKIDVNNPGLSQAHRQQHVRTTVDQTRSVTFSPGGTITSDGQFQRPDKNVGQHGVTVSAGSGAVRNSNGQFQPKNLAPVDNGIMSSPAPNLPMSVSVHDQNPGKIIRAFAPWAPPAITVDAGLSRAGSGNTTDNANTR